MNKTVEVFLWGTRVGVLHQEIDSPYASFQYDKNFQKSGIQLSPFYMPLNNTIYQFPNLSGSPFYGLPGLFSDSLPDKFGNSVINKWLMHQGKSLDDFTAIDRLCYTGKRGMGALEYVPVIDDFEDINDNINVTEMVKFASDVLADREKIIFNDKDRLTYKQLIQVGSSAGGARAKAIIAWNEKTNEVRSGQILLDKNYDYWLMKFDNVSNNGDHGLVDAPQYTLIEYAYYLMAKDCELQMNECRIYKDGTNNHFMTKRFDRIDGKKIHMQSLGALLNISYQTPALCSYEEASIYMKKLGLSKGEIEEFFRRMVFNCLAVNQDDHVKNISFLMDKRGKWTLSPFYDVTFSYDKENKWLKAHQMTINNKFSDITLEDLLMASKAMDISKNKALSIIKEVQTVVLSFRKYGKMCGIKDSTISYIEKIIKENSVI